MNYLRYYLPRGKHIQDGKALAELGFPHLADCSPQCGNVLANGPDGGAGVCFVAKAPDDGDAVSARVDLAKQEWHCCDGGRVWVGWEKGQKPTAADLRRKTFFSTYVPVELGDGNEWEFTPTPALPETFCYSETGAIGTRPLPQNRAYYEASHWLWEQIAQNMTDVKYVDIIDRLALLLGMNYRVGKVECIALLLFNQQTILEAAFAAVDMLDLYRRSKKNAIEAGTSASPSGGAASSPTTAPIGAI